MGAAMAATGLVTSFVPVLLTQMMWGLAWTFASGADVAWITDELAEPARIAAVLTRAGRAQLTGAAAGLVGLGLLASVAGRAPAMVLAGAGAVVLGGYVVVRFPERRFVPVTTRRWSASGSILRRGAVLIRGSRVIVVMLIAAFVADAVVGAAGRLFARRLVDLGFPAEPLVYYTGLNVLALLLGAVALRFVERRIDHAQTARAGYAVACTAGALGLAGLAIAPEAVSGSAAVLVISGIAAPLTRTIATVRVNRETTGDVRATVHSFLSQAEYAGGILCGLLIAVLAGQVPLPGTLLACGALLALTAALVGRVSTSPHPPGRACG
jgi:hypothetical protein